MTRLHLLFLLFVVVARCTEEAAVNVFVHLAFKGLSKRGGDDCEER